MALPSDSARSNLENALEDLIQSIETHDLWTPPSPNMTLYWVWDFVKRSKYMLSEFENVQHGRPLQYPNQFRPSPGTGNQAALDVFKEVCGRSMMAELLITDTSNKTALLTGNSGPPIEFGPTCKEKVQNLARLSQEGMAASGRT